MAGDGPGSACWAGLASLGLLDYRPVAGFGGLVATWVAGTLLAGLLGLFPWLPAVFTQAQPAAYQPVAPAKPGLARAAGASCEGLALIGTREHAVKNARPRPRVPPALTRA